MMPLRFLDMHMYVTSALQRTDMKAVGLQLALDLLHEKVGVTTLQVSCLVTEFAYTEYGWLSNDVHCLGNLTNRSL